MAVALADGVARTAIKEIKLAACESAADGAVSRDLFAEILGNEEEHVDFLEKQVEMIAWMGLQNYVQLQSEAAGS